MNTLLFLKVFYFFRLQNQWVETQYLLNLKYFRFEVKTTTDYLKAGSIQF